MPPPECPHYGRDRFSANVIPAKAGTHATGGTGAVKNLADARQLRAMARLYRIGTGGRGGVLPHFSMCGSGSTGLEPCRNSKCTCGWSTVPVLPALAMICPRLTTSSRFTSICSLWA
jgi:hypothetical protein